MSRFQAHRAVQLFNEHVRECPICDGLGNVLCDEGKRMNVGASTASALGAADQRADPVRDLVKLGWGDRDRPADGDYPKPGPSDHRPGGAMMRGNKLKLNPRENRQGVVRSQRLTAAALAVLELETKRFMAIPAPGQAAAQRELLAAYKDYMTFHARHVYWEDTLEP